MVYSVVKWLHGIGMIKQGYLAGKLSARHHIPHLVAEPLRLLARRGVVVQALLDHPVPGVVVIIIMMMPVMMLMLTFWELKEDPCYWLSINDLNYFAFFICIGFTLGLVSWKSVFVSLLVLVVMFLWVWFSGSIHFSLTVPQLGEEKSPKVCKSRSSSSWA